MDLGEGEGSGDVPKKANLMSNHTWRTIRENPFAEKLAAVLGVLLEVVCFCCQNTILIISTHAQTQKSWLLGLKKIFAPLRW